MGERLRSKREEMSLSLKEVENATSIRMTYLQAIEDGKAQHFLSGVYAVGFIRQYANFLGFESEKFLKEFPEVLRMPHEKQEFAYGIGTLEMRGSPQGTARWSHHFMWGAIFVVVAICAWYFAKFVGIF